MLESMTDEQFKLFFICTVYLAPILLSVVIYWATEKIQEKNKKASRKKVKK